MPRTTPSQSRIQNVIAALKESGLAVRSIAVAADGGFTVSVDEEGKEKAPLPPQWGKAG